MLVCQGCFLSEMSRSMEKRSWNNMSYDILLKIFMTLNMVDFATVSMVCRSWQEACQDIPALFWDGQVFDLSDMRVYSAFKLSFQSDDEASRSRLTQFLKCALDLTCGKITCFIFNFLQSINDDDLLLVAQRTANLKRLVLPRWNFRLTETGFKQGMQLWRGLESLIIPDVKIAYNLLETIGEHCNNLSELKVSCDFSMNLAEALIKNVPKLKILTLQSILLCKNALVHVANNLKRLEILNISHSFIVGLADDGINITLFAQHDMPIILENSNMPETSTLITCDEWPCEMCDKVLEWNISAEEWKNPKEEVWRDDKISSLRF